MQIQIENRKKVFMPCEAKTWNKQQYIKEMNDNMAFHALDLIVRLNNKLILFPSLLCWIWSRFFSYFFLIKFERMWESYHLKRNYKWESYITYITLYTYRKSVTIRNVRINNFLSPVWVTDFPLEIEILLLFFFFFSEQHRNWPIQLATFLFLFLKPIFRLISGWIVS